MQLQIKLDMAIGEATQPPTRTKKERKIPLKERKNKIPTLLKIIGNLFAFFKKNIYLCNENLSMSLRLK